MVPPPSFDQPGGDQSYKADGGGAATDKNGGDSAKDETGGTGGDDKPEADGDEESNDDEEDDGDEEGDGGQASRGPGVDDPNVDAVNKSNADGGEKSGDLQYHDGSTADCEFQNADDPTASHRLAAWLKCPDCSGLHSIWCDDVIAAACSDLFGSIGLLGGFFYTSSIVCPAHLPLLARCCQLMHYGCGRPSGSDP